MSNRQYSCKGAITDVCHKVAVIGLGQSGLDVIRFLLDMGISPVDIVAVDAFDTDKFGVRRWQDRKPDIETVFPEESEWPGIIGIPETGSYITHPYTDDLNYSPVAVCQLAIITAQIFQNTGWAALYRAEEMVTLSRLGVKWVVNYESDDAKFFDQLGVFLPLLED